MKRTKKTALGGMLAALSVVILFLAGVIPVFVFAFPAIAGLLLLPVLVEMDWRWGFGVYAVVAVLSLLLVPDREVAFYYVALFGHYPVTKYFLERLPGKALKLLAKLGTFAVSVGVSVLLVVIFFGAEYLVAEYAFLGKIGLMLLAVVSVVTLFLYDFVLGRFSVLYVRVLRPRVRKLLG